MSFFYDFLNYFKIDRLGDSVAVSMIFDKGLALIGNIKISHFSNKSIEILSNNAKISVLGENLKIKSMSKGEIFLSGKIFKIESGGL